MPCVHRPAPRPDGKPPAGVRVLYESPGPNEVLASMTKAVGSYEGEASVGSITVQVTHRAVDAAGKARALVLLRQTVEVPAEGKTFDFQAEKGVPG